MKAKWVEGKYGFCYLRGRKRDFGSVYRKDGGFEAYSGLLETRRTFVHRKEAQKWLVEALTKQLSEMLDELKDGE